MADSIIKVSDSYIDSIFTQAVHLAARDSSAELEKNLKLEKFIITAEKENKIKKAYLKRHFFRKVSSGFKYFNHKFGKVAATVLITLAISFGSVTAVASVRNMITKLLISLNPEYTQLQLQQKDSDGNVIERSELFIAGMPLPAYLPDGYDLVTLTLREQMCDAYYMDSGKNEIAFSSYTSDMMLNIDSEGALQSIERIGDTEVYMVDKKGALSASWKKDNQYFVLIANESIKKSEFVKIISSIK